MLVQATRKLLDTQGLRSSTVFNSHFNALSKRENSPTAEAILHSIEEGDVHPSQSPGATRQR